MKSFGFIITNIVLLFVICSGVSARLFYLPGQSYYSKYQLVQTLESNVEIENCGDEGSLFKVEKFEISPDIIESNKEIVLKATGNLLNSVTAGAYVKVSVKYGLIRLIAKTVDLCEELDDGCPLEKGSTVIKKTLRLDTVPPGMYTVTFDVYSDDDESVLCAKLSVNVPRPSFN